MAARVLAMMADRKLPLYTSTDGEQVRAAKIEKLNLHRIPEGSATITPEGGGPHFVVGASYIFDYDPEVGGYFIVRADDYQAFLPANIFEAEYTLDE